MSLYARPALSFLDVVFHEDDAFEPGVVFIPSRRALAELAVWLAFVPFMSVDLRSPVDTRVFATDASSRTCAAVVTRLPADLCREIWRQRPRRGVGQRYAGEAAFRVADEEDLASVDESGDESEAAEAERERASWASELCEAVGWQPVFQYSLRRCEHIVTKEARPICTLVRSLAAEEREGGLRVIDFADNSPNIGAWAKGRSSSGRLKRHLRQVAPDMLLTDLQLAVPHAFPCQPVRRADARTCRSPLASRGCTISLSGCPSFLFVQ